MAPTVTKSGVRIALSAGPVIVEPLLKVNVGVACAVKTGLAPLVRNVPMPMDPPKAPVKLPPDELVSLTAVKVPREALNPAKEVGEVLVLTVVPKVLKETGPTVWVWVIA